MMAETQELIPGLPDDIAYECLTRIQTLDFFSATGVCTRWRGLLKSNKFSFHRKTNGLTHLYACLIQARWDPNGSSKPVSPSDFGVTVFDTTTRSWERVELPTEYAAGLPLFCEVASTEGKLVLMGGWHPESYEPVTRVYVYDFLTRKWREGKDMPSKRSFFATGGINGRVYIAGGHDLDKNGLSTTCVYDVLNDDWTELTEMIQVRDECQGLVVGSEFWVISGYDTENQGVFKSSAEVYDVNTGEWTQVEDVWSGSRTPRSCIGLGNNKELVNWAESCPEEARFGTCTIELGNRVLLSGSPSEGANRVFFLCNRFENGNYGEFEKLVNVPIEFMGFVQSGCYVLASNYGFH